MVVSPERRFNPNHSASVELNSLHYQELVHKRGLDPDWVQVNCLSVDKQTASEHLGYEVYSDGILLKGVGSQKQFKPDQRWKSKNGKLSPKYLTGKDESGYDAMLPIHPYNPNFWDAEELKKHCYQINGVPCIVITEGPFKAIALTSHGVPTLSLMGVEMGLTSGRRDPKGEQHLVGTLEHYVRGGFSFIMAFDADCATKVGVERAQDTLVDKLSLFECPVHSITGLWHEADGKGIDDYILMNGFEQFRDEVLSNAESIEAWKKKHLANLGRQFQKSRHPHSPNAVAKEIAEDYCNKLAFNNETGVWMRYEAEGKEGKGVWSPETDTYVEYIINSILESKNIEIKTHSYIVNIIKCLRLQKSIIRRKWIQRSSREVLPFHNGVLEIATGKFLGHSPENNLTWTFPREYNPVAKDWSRIREWLEFAAEGNKETINILICYMAAVVKGISGLQKFLHLIGWGGSGKGTFARLLTDLIGENNVCSTSVDLFCTNRFKPINAYGKRLLLFADEQVLPKNIGNLMKAVGGDTLEGEKKGKDSFSFKFDGMALMISEHPIAQGVKGNGWKRRVISVPMNAKVADHKRRDLNKDFQPELAAFTNYLLSLDDEFIIETLRGAGSSPVSQRSFWQSRLREDSIAAWLNDCVIHDPSASTPVGADKNEAEKGKVETLFGSYNDYCKRLGLHARSGTRFSPELVELCQTGLGWDVKKRKTRSANCISGIRLRVESLDSDILTHEEALTESVEGSVEGFVGACVEAETPTKQGRGGCGGLNDHILSIASDDLQKPESPPSDRDSRQSDPHPCQAHDRSLVHTPWGMMDENGNYVNHKPEKSPQKPEIANLSEQQKEDWLYRYKKTDKAMWVEHPKYTGLAKPIKPSVPGEWTVEPTPEHEKVMVLHTVTLSQISIPKSQLGDKIKPIPQPLEATQIELNLEQQPSNETPLERVERLAKDQNKELPKREHIKLKPGNDTFDRLCQRFKHSKLEEFTNEELTEIGDVWEGQIKSVENFKDQQRITRYLEDR